MKSGSRQKPSGLRLSHRSAYTHEADLDSPEFNTQEPAESRKPASAIHTFYSGSAKSDSSHESVAHSSDSITSSGQLLPVWMAEEITVSTIFMSPILGVKESVQDIITETLGLIDYRGDDPFHSLFEDVRAKGPISFVKRLPDNLPVVNALEILKLVIVIVDLPLHLVRGDKNNKLAHKGDQPPAKTGESHFFLAASGSADVNVHLRSQDEDVPGEQVTQKLGSGDDEQSEQEPPIAFSDDRGQGGQNRQPWSQQCDSFEDDSDAERQQAIQGDGQEQADGQEGSGSALHDIGKCRPCHFHQNGKNGCRGGSECPFCHRHGKRPGKLKRDREKRRMQWPNSKEPSDAGGTIDDTQPSGRSAQSSDRPPPPRTNLSL